MLESLDVGSLLNDVRYEVLRELGPYRRVGHGRSCGRCARVVLVCMSQRFVVSSYDRPQAGLESPVSKKKTSWLCVDPRYSLKTP